MEITSTQFKHCDLVRVTGRIDSATAPRLAEELNKIIDAGRFKIVIDLEGVDFISSAGLRVLISVQKTCKRYNRGEAILSSVPATIYSALDLAGFVPLFQMKENVTSAVGEF